VVDGSTSLVGLIGWPVEHSLSPAMHNAAFDGVGLNWRYVPLRVRPGQMPAAVRGLGALGFVGANVTVPHKQAALTLADDVDATARALGAVNTLVIGRPEGKRASIAGHNTDADGFIWALRAAGYDPRAHGSAVVVGAGGAARAIVYGLLSDGNGDIVVLNRTLPRAQRLCADVGSGSGWRRRLRAAALTHDTLVEEVRKADLLVNATTVGMWPDSAASIWPAGVRLPARVAVFDLVYNPLETLLLRQARASGAGAIDGLEMLIQQGALAFGLWTDHRYDHVRVADLMRDACRLAMQA
jgi:shikimate dehydrogenase